MGKVGCKKKLSWFIALKKEVLESVMVFQHGITARILFVHKHKQNKKRGVTSCCAAEVSTAEGAASKSEAYKEPLASPTSSCPLTAAMRGAEETKLTRPLTSSVQAPRPDSKRAHAVSVARW